MTPNLSRLEIEKIAKAALRAKYSRPPSKRVAASAAALRSRLLDPYPLFAYAALLGQGVEPNAKIVDASAEILREEFPDLLGHLYGPGDLDAVDRISEERDEALAQLAQLKAEVKDSRSRLKWEMEKRETMEKEMSSLRDLVGSRSTELTEVQSIARRLWVLMPTEGKLRIFEEEDGWLPQWVRSRAAPAASDEI